MGLDMFRQHIILNNLVQSRIVDGLLMLIEKERLGDSVDRLLLKSLLRMLCDLQLYSAIFESKFVSHDFCVNLRIILVSEEVEWLNCIDSRGSG